MLLAAALSLVAFPSSSWAWKVHSHVLATNAAVLDAMDGAICLPGLTGNGDADGQQVQVPLGQTRLDGWELTDEGVVRYHFLDDLAPYLRAGSVGPDGVPDPLTGQRQSHVDWTRGLDNPLDQADEATAGLEESLGGYAPLLGHQVGRFFQPVFEQPAWRSSDWGHEILREALSFNYSACPDLTPSEYKELVERADMGLLQPEDPEYGCVYWYQEQRKAIAFALGYLMHLSGDGFAHTWVNKWTEQPFDHTTGRREGVFVPGHGVTRAGSGNTIEEYQHIAIEGYVDERYAASAELDTCNAVPLGWTENEIRLCQPDVRPPMDCSMQPENRLYCNPLRGTHEVPPDFPLSSVCDKCYPLCNPWREICPPRLPEGHTCREACADLEEQIFALNIRGLDPVERRMRIEPLLLECMDREEECFCTGAIAGMRAAGWLDESETVGTCMGPDARTPSERWQALEEARTEMAETLLEQIEAAGLNPDITAPNGCYLGPVSDLQAPEFLMPLDDYLAAGGGAENMPQPAPDEIVVEDGEQYVQVDGVDLGHGDEGPDLCRDGKPDLLNHCVMLNCLFDMGNCPCWALNREAPEFLQAPALECSEHQTAEILADEGLQDEFLTSTDLKLPYRFYRHLFINRRLDPSHMEGIENLSGVGNWALGGPLVNGVHVVTDLIEVTNEYLFAISEPLLFLLDHCPSDDADEMPVHRHGVMCNVGIQIAGLIGAVYLGAAVLVAAGVAMMIVPFVGQAVGIALVAAGTALAVVAAALQEGIVPGFRAALTGILPVCPT